MKIELLSPSGDINSLKLAIDNGADAVYLGLQNFNARRTADNFTSENIADYVKYAHLFNVKVYVTLNTNIKNEEIESLKSTILACKKARVDAFIITDFLTAKLVRELTSIPMHASTQMGINNVYGAKYLQKLGFSRIVLARETKIEDIKKIKKETNLEIEYFVHGALCVSYSGQCLFSSTISGESANRGLCKQPCRQLYKNLSTNKDFSYLLSTKDLCLIDELKLLQDLGIDSLKIEGRLKRAEYVGIVTNAYRYAIDNLDNEIDYKNLYTNLRKIYNRGEFTKGYLFNENIMYDKTQNHIGDYVGKIIQTNGKNSVLNCKDFNEKNGYKIFRNNKEITGGNFKIIQKLKNGYLINYAGKVNDVFRITTDNSQIENINTIKNKLKINIFIKIKENQKIDILAKYKNICINIQSKDVVEKSINSPITQENVKEIFNKTGELPILVNQNIELDNNVFLRLSVLNNLRKQLYKEIIDKIVAINESNLQNSFINNSYYSNFQNKEYFAIQNNDYIEQNKNRKIAVEINNTNINYSNLKKIDSLIINLQDYSIDIFIIEHYAKIKLENNFKYNIFLKLPTILNSKDLIIIENILNKYTNFIQGIYSNTPTGFELSKKYNLLLFGGVGQNIYNDFSASNNYFDSFTISTELKNEEIISIASKFSNAYVYSYGHLPLMTFAHCTNNNGKYNCKNCNNNNSLVLKDKKFNFNVLRTKVNNCYFTLYNCFCTNILDFSAKYNFNIYVDMLQYTNEREINNILYNILNNNKLSDTYTKGNLIRGVK